MQFQVIQFLEKLLQSHKRDIEACEIQIMHMKNDKNAVEVLSFVQARIEAAADEIAIAIVKLK